MLDLLCTLLLAPQAPPDVAGLRYVRWACRHLQGGRPGQHSPYAQTYRDALTALRRAHQLHLMPAAQPRAPPPGAAVPVETPSQQRLARPSMQQSLSGIAGVVTGLVVRGRQGSGGVLSTA